MLKRVVSVCLLLLLLTAGFTAYAEEYRIAKGSRIKYVRLLDDLLMLARKTPASYEETIWNDLEEIRRVSETDYEVASAIADHWQLVFLRGTYPFNIYDGQFAAAGLEETGVWDSSYHAFVVLGYALQNGKMTNELKGRCDAAAAAARAFPNAVIVCSGGATGSNNPKRHTEAGMMKEYLTDECGLDAERIYTDEKALTTVENAVNTLRILMDHQVETITLVTSTYHQRWSQVLYNAMSAMYRQLYGYSVEIVSNYCFEIEPSNNGFKDDARMAISQLSTMLKLK